MWNYDEYQSCLQKCKRCRRHLTRSGGINGLKQRSPGTAEGERQFIIHKLPLSVIMWNHTDSLRNTISRIIKVHPHDKCYSYGEISGGLIWYGDQGPSLLACLKLVEIWGSKGLMVLYSERRNQRVDMVWRSGAQPAGLSQVAGDMRKQGINGSTLRETEPESGYGMEIRGLSLLACLKPVEIWGSKGLMVLHSERRNQRVDMVWRSGASACLPVSSRWRYEGARD